MRGKFVTFEGCEGSGKSTQIRLLAEKLTAAGVDLIVTREPGGSDVAEQIRKIILDGGNENMCDECEALLYAAARIQHLKEIVEPALAAGKLVICDRYVDSSLAYQGAARGLGESYVENINSAALANYPPDLTVFLDIAPDKAFDRKHGADLNDRMEKQGLEFHMKVYAGYKSLLGKYPRICAVECGGTKYETAEKIFALLKNKGII
ncbi:MAG: dTMP kinase [Clostridia bacterium]|nr:dTMP kinase [Clostridia bacterium]MDE7256962.1 dTMP kinase [Clostridia bacterium]